MKSAKEASNLTNRAWGLYTDNKATAAVTAFGRSGTESESKPPEIYLTNLLGAIKAKKFVRFFQEILSEQGLEYMVAPYSACAQVSFSVGRKPKYYNC